MRAIIYRDDDGEITGILNIGAWRAYYRCLGKTEEEIDKMLEKMEVFEE